MTKSRFRCCASALATATLAICAWVPSSANAQTVSVPNSQKQQSGDAEEIVVTGSNLKTRDPGSAANLRILDAQDIARTGAPTVAALLQRIPEAGFGGFGENQFNTSSPGSAAVSLRGLGANATLVLVNGRRVANAPFARNTSGGSAGGLGTISFVDLNLIPVSAIQRVEILKDGAGAVYGADAVAGVVNLILHRGYNGISASAYVGNFTGTQLNAPTYRVNLLAGTSNDEGGITVAFNYEKRERLAFRNLPYSVTSLSTTGNPGTFVVPVGGRNPITGATIPAGASTASRTFYVVPGGSPGNVRFSTTAAPENSYDNVGDASVQPAGTRLGLFVNGDYDLATGVSAFVELIGARVTSEETSTPSSISNLNDITLPANNPFNPFGVTLRNIAATGQTQIRYRFVEYGTDTANLETDFFRIVGGLRGRIGKSWDWEVAQVWNRAQSDVAYINKPSEALVNAALADTNPATALNLFTSGTVQNNATVLARILPNAVRTAKSDLLASQVSVRGSVFELPAGPTTLAVGAEYRRETFSDARTPDRLLSRGPSPAPASGSRETKSAYLEVGIPLVSSLNRFSIVDSADLTFALRTESFDTASIGTTTKPRIGFAAQLFDRQVALRASWGKGFRAPSLTELFLPATAGTVPFTDPLRFGRPGSDPALDGNVTRFNITGGNLSLKPEESRNISFGTTIKPQFVSGLSITVDYFDIEVINRIGTPTLDFVLNNPDLFPGQINRAAPTAFDIANNLPGVLIGVNQPLSNLGYVVTKGWDVGLRYQRDVRGLGTLTFNASGTFVSTLRVKLQPNIAETETIGTYENPGTRGRASLFWNNSRAEIGATLDYIGTFAERTGSPKASVESQTTVGIQSSVNIGKIVRATLGLNNVFNTRPPIVNQFSSTTGYAERTNSWQPRFAYVELSARF